MVDRRVLLLRQLFEMPADSLWRVLFKDRCESFGVFRDLFLIAACEPELFFNLRPRTESFRRIVDELLFVPPKTGVNCDVGVEQVWLEKERLDDKQAGERLADDGRFLRGAIAALHLGHQL